MTIAELKTFIAVYMGRSTANDLILNGLDTALVALNSARRYLERAHNFKYAEVNAFVQIPPTGGSLTACFPVVALTGTLIGVKSVSSVMLPVASSGYQPIEFMTEDEWVARTRRQIGRQPYDANKTLAQLGVTTNMNPVAYQQGQTLFLDPSPGSPIAQLNVTRWMPDYVTNETDFFTTYAPEALHWQAIIECNKFWRRFVPKQESNIDEGEVQKMADTALASLIAWDVSTMKNTSTPEAQAPVKA